MKAKIILVVSAFVAGALFYAIAQQIYARFHRFNLSHLSLDAGGDAQHRYNLHGATATTVDAGDYSVLIPPAGKTPASIIVQSKKTGSAVIFSRFADRNGIEVFSPSDSTGLFIIFDGPRGVATNIVLRNRLSAFHEVWTVNNPRAFGFMEQRVVLDRNAPRNEKSKPLQSAWKIETPVSGIWSGELKEAQIVQTSRGEEYVVDGKSHKADTTLLRALGVLK